MLWTWLRPKADPPKDTAMFRVGERVLVLHNSKTPFFAGVIKEISPCHSYCEVQENRELWPNWGYKSWFHTDHLVKVESQEIFDER